MHPARNLIRSSHVFVPAVLFCLLGVFTTGCGMSSFLITPVSDTNKLDEHTVLNGSGLFRNKIAIIEVEGVLANAKSGSLLGASENPVSLFTQELNKAADDSDVKAIVLRVNSPGGTVSGSDAMYQILKRFKAKTHKPVVASIQEVGASGAYYVSCGADKIVAQSTSLVGSIGVIFETFNLEGTLNKLGARSENYKSAPHKDLGSYFRQPTDEEKQIMQQLVDDYFAKFKSIVTDNRKTIDTNQFSMITDGRVFSGDKALQLGLIDQTGLLEDAIDLAKSLSNNKNADVVEYKRPYAYSGSIYAQEDAPTPKSNVLQLQLPDAASVLPSGFYYMWKP